jgi:aspartyl-tRNA(Asn)/glutamyl-tRNA(Gln) amidotransferase subunit B
MRSKEEAHDYRYFPEPDLMPLIISDQWREEIRRAMPELPAAKRQRFVEEYGLSGYDAGVLSSTQALADFFEEAAKASGDAKTAANWVQGDLTGALNATGKTIAESPVSAANLAELVKLIAGGTLSGKLGKEVFARMLESGRTAGEIIEAEGLKQISDTGALQKIIEEVLAKNPGQVETYKNGKTSVLGFFVGQVMKATRGQANPGAVNELLKKALE